MPSHSFDAPTASQDHFKESCCRVLGSRRGAGFFIAQDIIVTCEHNVSRYCKGTEIEVELSPFDGPSSWRTATLIDHDARLDIALLRIEVGESTPLKLSTETPLEDDRLRGFGFPEYEAGVSFDTFTAVFEGITEHTEEDGSFISELKFKEGHVVHGYSGGPLVNRRTGMICGMVTLTRDSVNDLGGWAVPTHAILALCARNNIDVASIGRTRQTTSQQDNLPERPNQFISRHAEVQRILDALNGTKSILVHGAPGAGKTSVVSELCRTSTAKERFPDGILWATLGPQPDSLSIMADWLKALGEEAPIVWNEKAALTLIRNLMKDRKILIVLDDIWNPEDVKCFQIAEPKVKIVATSRRAAVADAGISMVLPLGALSENECAQIVHNRCGGLAFSDAEFRVLGQLYDKFEFNALAVDLIGSLLSRSVSVTLIENAASNEMISPALGSSLEQRISACYKLSIDHLRQSNPTMYQRAEFLSVVQSDGFIHVEDFARLWGIAPQAAHLTLWSLVDDALISGSGEQFRLHQLSRIALSAAVCRTRDDGVAGQLSDLHMEVCRNLGLLDGAGSIRVAFGNGYVLKNFVWHLVKAGEFSRVRNLCKNTDFLTRIWPTLAERKGVIASYVSNLDLIMDENCRASDFAFDVQINCVLARVSMTTAAAHMPHGIVTFFVYTKQWSPEKALIWCDAFAPKRKEASYYLAVIQGLDLLALASPLSPREENVRDQCWRTALARLQLLEKHTLRTAGEFSKVISKAPKAEQRPAAASTVKLNTAELRVELARYLEQDLRDEIIQEVFGDGAAQLNLKDALNAINQAFQLASVNTKHLLESYFVSILSRVVSGHAEPSHGSSPNKTLTARRLPLTEGGLGKSVESFTREPARKSTSKPVSMSAAPEPQKPKRSIEEDYTRYLPMVVGDKERRETEDNRHNDDSFWRNEDNIRILKAIISSLSKSNLITIADLVAGLPSNSMADILTAHCKGTLSKIASAGSANSIRSASVPHADGRAVPRFLELLEELTDLQERQYALLRKQGDDQWVLDDDDELNGHINDVDHQLAAIASGPLSDRKIAALAEIIPVLDRLEEKKRKLYWFSIQRYLASPVATLLGPKLAQYGKSNPARFFNDLIKLSPQECFNALGLAEAQFSMDTLTNWANDVARIGDEQEQFAAYISLISGVSPEGRHELNNYWEDTEKFGKNSIGRSELINSLSQTITQEKMHEIAQAVAKGEGEWWVVEAFTLAVARLETGAELVACKNATSAITALDLRIKLLGRLAKRCLDLSLIDIMDDVVVTIGTGPLAEDELAGLGVRAASIARTDLVDEISEKIVTCEGKDRLWWSAGLELAALGLHKDAERMHCQIVSKRWNSMSTSFVVLDGNSVAKSNDGQSILSQRQKSRKDTVESSKIANLRRKMQQPLAENIHLELCSLMQEYAIDLESDDEFQELCAIYWRGESGGHDPAHIALCQMHRPKILAFISAASEVFSYDDQGQFAYNTLMAVKSCAARWQ